MNEQISILLLEDSPNDAELLRLALKSGGIDAVTRQVSSESKFQEALRDGTPDLIICDYSLPGYSGKAALTAAQILRPEIPFIFFSGTIGEEAAIEALKSGATDYVLKDKPKRLVSAIHRALAQAEQRRHHIQSEKRIRDQAQLLDLATDAIIVRDLDDRVQFWNQGAERLYGFNRDEVVGKKSTEFIPTSSHAAFKKAKEIALEKGHWEGEMEHRSKAQQPMIVNCRWTLVRSQRGEPERILAINSDITEKKRLEQQFLRAQRLESIGALASGIAHDLNNILAPILMACEFLKDEQKNDEAANMIDMAVKSAQRGASLVSQLLAFVKGTEGKRTLLQTNNVLNEICIILEKTLPKNIKIKREIHDGLLPIEADPTQLHQVLMNLCVNARDAMPKGGDLAITATNTPHSFILIRVEDTGTGIAPGVIEKIFDPFFTTKEIGKGTGLGLSTVATIVKAHGGALKVETEVGAGTVFEISLPAAAREAK